MLPLNSMEGEHKSVEKQARAEKFGEVDVKEETEATEGIGDDLFTNLETSQSSHMGMGDKSIVSHGDGRPDFGTSNSMWSKIPVVDKSSGVDVAM